MIEEEELTIKWVKIWRKQITREETQRVRKHLKNVQPTGVNGNANKSTNGAIFSAPISWQQTWWGCGIKGKSSLWLAGMKAADVHRCVTQRFCFHSVSRLMPEDVPWASFVIAIKRKQSKSPPVVEWISKSWCSQTDETCISENELPYSYLY